MHSSIELDVILKMVNWLIICSSESILIMKLSNVIKCFIMEKMHGLMVAVVIVTCYSRIYLAYHFPFDILLGAVTGALTAGIAIGVCKVIKNKYGNN